MMNSIHKQIWIWKINFGRMVEYLNSINEPVHHQYCIPSQVLERQYSSIVDKKWMILYYCFWASLFFHVHTLCTLHTLSEASWHHCYTLFEFCCHSEWQGDMIDNERAGIWTQMKSSFLFEMRDETKTRSISLNGQI